MRRPALIPFSFWLSFWLSLCLAHRALAAPPPAPIQLLGEIEGHFHAARRWFGMVAELPFDRGADGSYAPRFAALQSKLVLAQDPAGESLRVRLPATADGTMSIRLASDGDVSVRTREEGIVGSPAEIARGVVLYRGAVAGGDLLYKLTPTHVDEYLYLRQPPPALVRRVTLEVGPHVVGLRRAEDGSLVEVVARDGVARLRVTAPLARAADGTRRRGTLRVEGFELVEEIDLRGLAAPILVDPDWSTTGAMTQAHWSDSAWLRPDGMVMVVGGCALTGCPVSFAQSGCGQVLASTDVWSPATGTWTSGPPLATARFSFASAALPSGDFLVAGGCTVPGCGLTTASAEIYSAATGRWSSAGSLATPRANAMATVLGNGDVLVAGGCDGSTCTTSAERYQPATGSWVTAAPLPASRGYASASTLSDGRALVVGGCADVACATVLGDALVYDPSADRWSWAGSMSVPRAAHTATTLADGTVLVAGGCSDAACATSLATAELWTPDPTLVGTFKGASRMASARHNHTATRLATGEVLVAGGAVGATPAYPSAEAYVPRLSSWVQVGPVPPPVPAYHIAVLLSSAPAPLTGDVLIAGGCNQATCLSYADVYSPASLPAEEADGGARTGVDSGAGGDVPTISAAGLAPHPPLYRTGAMGCATDTVQDLPCPVAGYPLEDADFQPDQQHFVPLGDGEIQDTVTGLVWQGGGDGNSYQEADAKTYCQQLSLGAAGPGSWRLPTVVELMGLVDYGVDGPSIDGNFVGTQPTNYWTSTTVASSTSLAWTVKFDAGELIPLLIDTPNPVRCVRSGGASDAASGRLRLAGPLTGNGTTVRDDTTGLEWQQRDDGVKRDWRGALEYCASLDLAGERGWHLPNIAELRGLVEYGGGVSGVAIDPVFADPKSDIYWTSTPNEGAPTLSWSVSFNLGVVDGVVVTGPAYVRCVRHLAQVAPASGCGCSLGGARRPLAGAPGLLLVAGLVWIRRRRSHRRRLPRAGA